MAGIIFYGSDAGTEGRARAEAQGHLGSDDIESDICFIRYRDRAGMDDIRDMLERIGMQSDGYVVWFDRAGELSANCQNAMLKALEDREDVLFLFFSESRLLATVESRCEIRRARRLSLDDFRRLYAGVSEGFYHFSMGSEECLAEIQGDSEISGIVSRIYPDVPGFLDRPREVLGLFGMLKEKGSSFFDTHREYVPNLYSFLESLILIRHMDDARALRVLDVIEEHKELLRRSSSYGRNDFFDFLVGICGIEE